MVCTRTQVQAPLYRKALAVVLAALLVLTMNPVVEMGSSAWAAPSSNDQSATAVDAPGRVGDAPQQETLATPRAEGGQASESTNTPDASEGSAQDAPGESTGDNAQEEQPEGDGASAPTTPESTPETTPDTPDVPATPQAPEVPEAPEAEELTLLVSWLEVAQAIEEGTLEGENFKPFKDATDKQGSPAYRISTPEAFAWWALLHADEPAVLHANIDLTRNGHAFPPNEEQPTAIGEESLWPGNTNLTAEFDGKSHAVVFNTEGAGLFEKVSATGAVRWLYTGVNFTDRKKHDQGDKAIQLGGVITKGALAGSIAGVNEGEIRGVVNRLDVSAQPKEEGTPADAAHVGGLVGENNGVIRDSANLRSVTAGENAESVAAGIAAKGTGTIAQSYHAGNVISQASGAAIITDASKPDQYQMLVDETCAYLESATYENVNPEREGALTETDLKAADARLNAGREGDGAVWFAGTDEAAMAYPTPTTPLDGEGALPEKKAPPAEEEKVPDAVDTRQLGNTHWSEVAAKVHRGEITESKTNPSGNVKMGGSGTKADPFTIDTPEALAYLAYLVNGNKTDAAGLHHGIANQHYKFTADIDLQGTGYVPAGQSMGWDPIGQVTRVSFTHFDSSVSGGLHTISNLTIESNSSTAGNYRGLFGNIEVSASSSVTFDGLLFDNAKVEGGPSDASGILAGNLNNPGNGAAVFTRIGVKSGVVSGSVAGGLIGTDGTSAGATRYKDCFNRAKVIASAPFVTPVSSGLVGMAASFQVFENCYYAGSLPKIDNALVGGSASVVNCYYENATVNNTNGAKILPWDHSLSVNFLNAGRTGMAAVWFSDMGNTNGGYPQFTGITSWAQIGERVAKGEITQTASGRGGVKMGGSGSQADPYTIDSPEALAYLSYLIRANKQDDAGKSHGQSGSYYKLTSDIDLSGEDYAGKNLRVDWAPIGANETAPFAASFDGNLKLITNLTISAESKGEGYDGLFGYVEKTMDVPSISRLHMSNVVLDRNSSEQAGAVAALVNNKSGSGPLIERVGVMGGSTIKGICAGGLVGIDITAGIKASLYRDVFSRARIYAAQDAGGILGYANTSQKFENVYYAGYGARYPIEGGKKANTYTNVYALPGSGLRPQGGAVVEKTAADMVDSGFVETLNANRADSDAPWSVDFVEINDKYPHFGGFTYTSWGQVGMAVAKGFITTTQDGNGSVEIGGSGSKEDPFTIDSPEALAYFSHKVNVGDTSTGEYYKLAADIDLIGTGYAAPGEKLEWLPIGSGHAFQSNFDGGFHTVSNLTVLDEGSYDNSGLFGKVDLPSGFTSTIENLYLTKVDVGRGPFNSAGALVGYVHHPDIQGSPAVTIAQIGVLSGTVKGGSAGGVVGEGVGYPGKIKITNCFSRTSIQGGSNSGGIIGDSFTDQVIENCYFAGTGAKRAIDGLGEVDDKSKFYKNNYYKEGSAAQGHSVGVTKMTEAAMKERLFVNTLNGANTSPWLFNVSGTNDGFPSFDWAVSDWWDVGAAVAVGKITSSKTGPGKVTFSGGGTSSNPWTIETPEALAYLGYLVSKDGNEYAEAGKYFKLTADLDLSGTQYTEDGSKLNWIPIGGNMGVDDTKNSFRGNFDGGLRTISNLTITENAKILKSAGLFGKVFSFSSNPVVIKDLYLKEVSLASNAAGVFLGPLAGDIQGDRSSIKINRVGVLSGLVKGPHQMGGLVGRDYSNASTVTYSDCFSRVTLQEGSARGGLIGYSYGKQTLNNCYFAGAGAEYSILDEINSGSSYPDFSKCYYQEFSAPRTQGKSKTSTTMKQPAFALDLNDGRTADARAWYSDTAGKNDGYAAFDFSPSDWEDVGYGVSAGLITRTALGTGSVKWAGGNGTSGSPYLIDSPECLAYLSYLVKTQPYTYGDNTGVYYKLTADIDLRGSAYAGSGNTLDWLPISGYYKNGSDIKFRGKFNGDFYTVSNLTIVRQGYAKYDRVGMFGQLDGGAVVQNMYLKDVNIQRSVMGAAGWSVAGPLAGMASGTYQSPEILVERVGVISGTVSVTAGGSGGSASGMVGTNGRASSGIIHFKDCFTRAIVNCSVNSQNASGFINGDVWSPPRFTESYFAGSGAYYAFSSKYQDPPVRNNSFLSGSASVGQGVGRSATQMKSSAFISTLNNGRTGAARPWYNDSKNKNSGFPLYDFEVGSWEDVGLGVDAGFIRETSTGSGSVKPTGSGTQSSPWLINSPEALAYVSYKVSVGYADYVAAGKYFKLTDDIDLAGEKYAGVGNKLNWLPIGNSTNMFKSNFDGDLHTISNLTIDSSITYTSGAGLFGYVCLGKH